MHFLNSITSDRMRAVLEEVASRRPDVRTTLYILPAGQNRGVATFDWSRIRSATAVAWFLLVPPPNLRSIVTAAPEEEVFLWTGAVDIAYLVGLYERHVDASVTYPRRVLDFGCGCGRLTRYLGLSQRYKTIGYDVNPDHVAWCVDNLTNVSSMRNSTRPRPRLAG